MKPLLMLLSSKLILGPITLFALVHWFLYFASESPAPAGEASLLFSIEGGNWIERWAATALVIALAGLRAMVWDTDEDDAAAE